MGHRSSRRRLQEAEATEGSTPKTMSVFVAARMDAYSSKNGGQTMQMHFDYEHRPIPKASPWHSSHHRNQRWRCV